MNATSELYGSDINATDDPYGNNTVAPPAATLIPYDKFIEYRIAVRMLPIYTLLLYIPGTMGNFLALSVIVRKSMRNLSSSIFIMGLAVFDNITLLGFLLVMLYQIYVPQAVNISYCTSQSFIVSFGSSVSTWIVVAMSFERALIVSFPLKAPHWTSRTKAMICIVIIIVFNFLHYIHYFWTATAIPDYGYCYYNFEEYLEFLSTYGVYDSVMQSYIPLILIFLINSVIIVQMGRARKIQKEMAGGKENPNANNQITVMLLTVSITYFICVAPYALLQILNFYHFDPTNYTPHFQVQISLAYQFTTMLWMVNHSINVLLYSITGKKFRNEMMVMFTCGKYKGTGLRSSKYISDVTRSTNVTKTTGGMATGVSVSTVSSGVQ